MALYRIGTAAMDAQGVITGTGTRWREPLSLIRTGATIVFLTSPLKLSVISDIVSDTEMKAIQTDGEPVENGNYVILLNDSLTVDGMAQDVAETLRYYQSKETVIEEAIEFFKNFDLKTVQDLVASAEASAQKTDADRAATEQLKNDTQTIKDAAVAETNQIKADTDAIKNQTQQIKDSAVTEITGIKNEALDARDEAKNAQFSAEQSKIGADSAKAGAETARDEAQRWVQQVNPENILHKDQNLADIPDKPKARESLQVDRLDQYLVNSTILTSGNKNVRLILQDDGVWGYFNATDNAWKPLAVAQGGTGASTPANARINLQLNRFVQSPTYSYVTSPAGTKIVISDGGKIEFQNDAGQLIALPIVSGGTGALDAPGARRNIGGQWEETQQYLNSEAIVLRRPTATTNQCIAFYRETNHAAFRFGHEPNDQLATHSYNTDGTYRKKINQISANGDTSIFGNLSLDGNLTSAGDCILGRISAHRPTYPQLNLYASNRTDTGAYLRLEISPQVRSAPYFYQTVNMDYTSDSILNALPRTTGVLAVQGTSGREYKKDITTADSAEALARITSLEMVNFVYKDDEKQRVRFGVIAEDAEKIAPQYVKHNKFPIPGTEVFDSEGNKVGEEYQDRPSIDVNPIVMDLLGCIQEQQKQIDELKATIAEMQAMFVQLAK